MNEQAKPILCITTRPYGDYRWEEIWPFERFKHVAVIYKKNCKITYIEKTKEIENLDLSNILFIVFGGGEFDDWYIEKLPEFKLAFFDFLAEKRIDIIEFIHKKLFATDLNYGDQNTKARDNWEYYKDKYFEKATNHTLKGTIGYDFGNIIKDIASALKDENCIEVKKFIDDLLELKIKSDTKEEEKEKETRKSAAISYYEGKKRFCSIKHDLISLFLALDLNLQDKKWTPASKDAGYSKKFDKVKELLVGEQGTSKHTISQTINSCLESCGESQKQCIIDSWNELLKHCGIKVNNADEASKPNSYVLLEDGEIRKFLVQLDSHIIKDENFTFEDWYITLEEKLETLKDKLYHYRKSDEINKSKSPSGAQQNNNHN